MTARPSPDRAAAGAVERDAARYRWLRARDLDQIHLGGVFAGSTPDNVVLSEEDLDHAVDAAMAAEDGTATTSRPVDGDAADLAEVERENAVLRAALSALPIIAEECRVKWDAGMKAGKLLIALTDPTLRYRADITELHRAAAMPTKREATLTADRDRLAREVERTAWRSIETAPRDGTIVDLFTDQGTRLTNCEWRTGADRDPERCGPGKPWERLRMDGWAVVGSKQGCGCLLEERITHWRPLPDPPSDAAPAPAASTDGGA